MMPTGQEKEEVTPTDNRIRFTRPSVGFTKHKIQQVNNEGKIKVREKGLKSKGDIQSNKYGTKLGLSTMSVITSKSTQIQSLKPAIKNTSLNLQKSNQSVKNLTKIAKNSNESFGKDRFGYKQNYLCYTGRGTEQANEITENENIGKVEKLIESVDVVNTSIVKIKDLVSKTTMSPVETHSGVESISSTDSSQDSDNCIAEPMSTDTDTVIKQSNIICENEKKPKSPKLFSVPGKNCTSPIRNSKLNISPKAKHSNINPEVLAKTKARFQSRLTKASPPSPKLKPKPKFAGGPQPYRPLVTNTSPPLVTTTLASLAKGFHIPYMKKLGSSSSQVSTNLSAPTTQVVTHIPSEGLNSSHLSHSSCHIPGLKSYGSIQSSISRAPQPIKTSLYSQASPIQAYSSQLPGLRASFLTNTNPLNSASLHQMSTTNSRGNLVRPITTAKENTKNNIRNKSQNSELSANLSIKIKNENSSNNTFIKKIHNQQSSVPKISCLPMSKVTAEEKNTERSWVKNTERSWVKRFNPDTTLTKAVTERDASPISINCLEQLKNANRTLIQQHSSSKIGLSKKKTNTTVRSFIKQHSNKSNIQEDAIVENELEKEEEPQTLVNSSPNETESDSGIFTSTNSKCSLDSLSQSVSDSLPPDFRSLPQSKLERDNSAKLSSSKSEGKIQKYFINIKMQESSTNDINKSHDNICVGETPQKEFDNISGTKSCDRNMGLVRKRAKNFQGQIEELRKQSQGEKNSLITHPEVYKNITSNSFPTISEEDTLPDSLLTKQKQENIFPKCKVTSSKDKAKMTPSKPIDKYLFRLDSSIFNSQKKSSTCLVSPIYSDKTIIDKGDLQNTSLISPTYTYKPLSDGNSKNRNIKEGSLLDNEFDVENLEINIETSVGNNHIEDKHQSIMKKENDNYINENEISTQEKYQYFEEKETLCEKPEPYEKDKQTIEPTKNNLQDKHSWYQTLDGENGKKSQAFENSTNKETSPSENMSNTNISPFSTEVNIDFKESSPQSDVSSSSEFSLASTSLTSVSPQSETSIQTTPSLPNTPSIPDLKHINQPTNNHQSKDTTPGGTTGCVSNSSSGHFTNSLSQSELSHSKTTPSPNSLSEPENKDFLIDDEYTDQPELTFLGHEDDIEDSLFEKVDSLIMSMREQEEKVQNSILLDRIDSGHGGDSGILPRNTEKSAYIQQDQKHNWVDMPDTDANIKESKKEDKLLKRPTTFSPIHLHRIDKLRADERSLASVQQELPNEVDYEQRRKRTVSGVSLDTLSGQESIASDDLMIDYEERNSEDNEKCEKNVSLQNKFNGYSNISEKCYGHSDLVEHLCKIDCPLSGIPSISETNGVTLDWSTLHHANQDVVNIKSNLLKLKKILQEDDVGNVLGTEEKFDSLYSSLVAAESKQLTNAASTAGLAKSNLPNDGASIIASALGKEPFADTPTTALEESQDLKRQIVFLHQQIEDKDRKIKNLEDLLSIRNRDTAPFFHSAPITPSMATDNRATQTERVRPVSWPSGNLGGFISFRIGKFNQ